MSFYKVNEFIYFILLENPFFSHMWPGTRAKCIEKLPFCIQERGEKIGKWAIANIIYFLHIVKKRQEGCYIKVAFLK